MADTFLFQNTRLFAVMVIDVFYNKNKQTRRVDTHEAHCSDPATHTNAHTFPKMLNTQHTSTPAVRIGKKLPYQPLCHSTTKRLKPQLGHL
jgi:hypothetical protein